MLPRAIKLFLTALVVFLFAGSSPVHAAPAITRCTSGFSGSGMVINHRNPHDAFFTSGPIVKHVSHVEPGPAPCGFGPAESDILLGEGITSSSGIAIDDRGNLYVAAGRGQSTLIVKIEPPYLTPTVFFRGANHLAGIAIWDNVLYAADFGAGKVLRFDLDAGPSSVTTFATISSPMAIFASYRDDIFVTSNRKGTVEHIVQEQPRTQPEITTIAKGLSFPEGISGDGENLYIAAGAEVFKVSRRGGTPVLYAGTPVRFSHAVFTFEDGSYVTDSNSPHGNVFKIR